jgi:hypothetical protein
MRFWVWIGSVCDFAFGLIQIRPPLDSTTWLYAFLMSMKLIFLPHEHMIDIKNLTDMNARPSL